MNFQEKQIHKLSRQLNAKQEEHNRQKSIMIQKIQLLQSQIMDYQEKDMKNRQLNESIMMSYKQNQSFREQYSQKEINSLVLKHQQEIKALKKRHNDEKKRLEDQINSLKCENDKLKIDIERIHLENQKEKAEIRSQFQDKLADKDNDMNIIFQNKFQLINERLRQAQEMNNFFKNQLEVKKERCSNIDMYEFNKNDWEKLQRSKNNYENQNKLRKAPETISSINMRINRALVQLNPNNIKFNEKVKKIRQRIYEQL